MRLERFAKTKRATNLLLRTDLLPRTIKGNKTVDQLANKAPTMGNLQMDKADIVTATISKVEGDEQKEPKNVECGTYHKRPCEKGITKSSGRQSEHTLKRSSCVPSKRH